MSVQNSGTVLLVDDRLENLISLEAVVSDLAAEVVRATSGEEALRHLLVRDFAAVVLDVNMPGMDGLELARLIRERPRTRHTPIIFLTADDNAPEWVKQAYQLGAVDYLVKPVLPEVIRAKVSVFLELYRHRAAEQERVQEEMRRNEERLNLFLDNVTDYAVIITDTKGTVLEWEAGAERITGYSSREVLGQSIDIIFTHIDQASGVPSRERATAKEEGKAEDKRWHRRKDGTSVYANGVMTALRDPAGTLRGFAKVFRDETDRILADQELQKFKFISDHANDGQALIREDLTYAYANQFYLKERGYKNRDLSSLRHLDVDAQFDLERFGELFVRAGKGRVPPFESVHIRKDGTVFPVEITVTRVEFGEEPFLFTQVRDITQRRQVDEAIRQSEAQLAEVFRLAPALMAVLRGDKYIFARANERFHQLVGDRKVMGLPLSKAIPEVVTQGYIPVLDSVRKTGEPFVGRNVSLMLTRRPGFPPEERFLDFVFQPLRDSDGAVSGILMQGVDVTDRIRAEAAVRASEERFKAAVGATSEIMWTCDVAGLMNRNQPSWESYTGQSPEDYVGDGWVDAVHRDDVDVTIKTWRKAIAGGKTIDFQHRLRRHDGEYRYFSVRAVPLLLSDGSIREWVGTHTDITDQKNANESLARIAAAEIHRSELLSQVADASRAVNASLSVESIAEILTEKAREILDAHAAVTSVAVSENSEEEVVASSHSDSYDSFETFEENPVDVGICSKVRHTNRPIRIAGEGFESSDLAESNKADCNGGPPTRGWLAVPLVGHGGRNLGVIRLADPKAGEFTSEDEAVLVQLAAIAAVGIENARLYESLRERDQRKDEFLATLAHELRNPLAPLMSGLAVLQRGQHAEQGHKVVGMMNRQLVHLVHLVDDLLDVSRVTSGKITLRREPLDLRDAVAAAVETIRPSADGAEHSFDIQLPNEPIELVGDRTRLTQVITNLLNNSCKYTPPNGRIALHVRRDDDHAVVRVTDNGIGIPSDMLPKVFDIFTQVGPSIDRSQGGLGLGLALVRRLVEKHGGSVAAESDGPGKGSAFTIRLPLYDSGAIKSFTEPLALASSE